MAFEYDLTGLQRKLNPRRKAGDPLLDFLKKNAIAPQTPEEFAAREAGTPTAVPATAQPAVIPPASSVRGYRSAPSASEQEAVANQLRDETLPDGFAATGDLKAGTLSLTGTGNAQQSDLGSPAHLARIAVAERGLRDARVAAADDDAFAAGRSTFRQATPDELAQDRLNAIDSKKTVAGKKLATELYLGQLTNETARGNTGATLAVAADKRALDQQKLLLEAITAGATARKAGSEASLLDARQSAVAGGDYARAAALAGRVAPTDNYTFIPGLDPNRQLVGNRKTGDVASVTPQVRANVQRDAQGAYVTEAGKKRYLTPAELTQLQR